MSAKTKIHTLHVMVSICFQLAFMVLLIWTIWTVCTSQFACTMLPLQEMNAIHGPQDLNDEVSFQTGP